MHAPSTTLPSASRVAILAAALALIAASFASGVEAGITVPFKPSQQTTLSPGIDWAKGRFWTTGGRVQTVRVATIDPRHPQVKLKALLSNDKAVKRERSSVLAARKSRPGFLAMVAINGDMAKRQAQNAYAAPISMHIQNGELMVANACTRPVLGIDRDGGARIGDVRSEITISVPSRLYTRRIHRVNTHRDDGNAVLYTRRFARSTQTREGGVEIVLQLEGKLRPKDKQRVKVLQVRRGPGDTPLKWGQAVVSVKGTYAKWTKYFRAGQTVTLETKIVRNVNNSCGGTVAEAAGWSDIVEAIGGNHFSLRDRKITVPPRSVYPSGPERHPRTSIGVTQDGLVIMAVVDGRRWRYSIGVTLGEMGKFMKSQGAVHAFNLDGGGSSVISKRDPWTGVFGVANRPSDGRERQATNALAAFQYDPSG